MTILSVYYAPEHSRQSDRDYISKLQPPVIRLLDPDVQQIADMHALCPNAIIAPRIWTIDDNNGEAVRDLMADPTGTGRKHADRYRAQIIDWYSQASQRGLAMPPSERIYFNSANEPNQGGTPDKIATYCVAFLNQCKINGIRAAVLCLGVGWPDNTGPDTPVDWSPYAGIVEPIKRGSHWLELHEYHYKTGPQDGWRWLAGRHLQCPFDVPILLGEIGVDNYVDKARWDKEGGNRGWLGNVSPDAYAEMIERHIRGCDTRVVAALPFITDYRSNAWESFDTNAAHGALLARKDNMVPKVAPPTTPTPQPIPAGAAYILATAGANIRAKPKTGRVVTTVPWREKVEVLGYDAASRWFRVRWGGVEGFMSPDLLGVERPEPVVPVPPVGDTWARSIAWTLKWEGGLSLNPEDHGNWTGGRKGAGELKGTNFGISAASYPTLDIRNLTKEQAVAIYERDYWIPSGASVLEWPICLLVFDSAVLHGVGTAQTWLAEVGPDPYRFAAKRLRLYTKLDNWAVFGIAWVRRTADLLEAMQP